MSVWRTDHRQCLERRRPLKKQLRRWQDEVSFSHIEKRVIHEDFHSTEKARDSVDTQPDHFMLMIWHY